MPEMYHSMPEMYHSMPEMYHSMPEMYHKTIPGPFFGLAAPQPEWLNQQRDWRAGTLTDAQQQRLCQLTDSQTLFKDFNVIVKPRVVGSSNHTRIAQYMKRQLDNLGWTTEWDAFSDWTPYGQKQFRNLIGTFNPTVHRRLTLACHYDSKLYKNFAFAGATDSAMPCAMLLDLARTLQPFLLAQQNPAVTLQFIFFDGEEAFVDWTATDSIYGSRHLAKKWANEWYPTLGNANTSFQLTKTIDRMDMMVLLDLLGARNPRIPNYNGLGAENWYTMLPEIEQSNERLGCPGSNVPNVFTNRISFGLIQDDHWPWYKDHGKRIVHVIPSPFPSVWHTYGDNADAIDDDTSLRLLGVLRAFVARYLRLPV